MNMSIRVIAIVAIVLSSNGWAQESDPATEIAEQSTAEQSTAEQAAREVRQARIDVLIGTMAEEMRALRSTTNSKARHTLMTTHRENMREAMSLMRDMGGVYMREVMAQHMGPSRSPSADSDKPRHRHKRTSPARPRALMSDSQRLADLENRLDMMQVMMESMMEEQIK